MSSTFLLDLDILLIILKIEIWCLQNLAILPKLDNERNAKNRFHEGEGWILMDGKPLPRAFSSRMPIPLPEDTFLLSLPQMEALHREPPPFGAFLISPRHQPWMADRQGNSE